RAHAEHLVVAVDQADRGVAGPADLGVRPFLELLLQLVGLGRGVVAFPSQGFEVAAGHLVVLLLSSSSASYSVKSPASSLSFFFSSSTASSFSVSRMRCTASSQRRWGCLSRTWRTRSLRSGGTSTSSSSGISSFRPSNASLIFWLLWKA